MMMLRIDIIFTKIEDLLVDFSATHGIREVHCNPPDDFIYDLHNYLWD